MSPSRLAAAVPCRFAVAVSAFLLVAGACTDDDDGGRATSTTTTATADTTSSSAPTSSVGPAECSERDEVAGEVTDASRVLDADGDALADTASVTVVDETTMELVIDYGAGGRTAATYADDTVFTVAAVRIDRIVDVDGDGDDDLWIVVGQGASVEVVSLVLADGCELVRPDADVGANAFAVGASIGFTNGVECVDTDDDGRFEGFETHEGENVGDSTYRGTSTTWTVEDDRLERGDTVPFEVDAETGAFAAYAELTCT